MLEPLKIGDATLPIPVVQGGMGVGVSLSGLAGAVAACGGMGIISTAQIGYRDRDFDTDPVGCNLRAIKEEIDKAREIAGICGCPVSQKKEKNGRNAGMVGVNIMVATRRYEEYVRAAVAAGADIIISGAGLPMSLPELAGDSGTKLAPIVSSLKSVQVLMKYWMKKYSRLPDMIVAEGPLAGGHLGFTRQQLADIPGLHYEEELMKIIRYVRECGEKHNKVIPVVAAGGIYGRADAERYFALGASGVQMATRFVTTYECDASEAYKQMYIKAKQEDIVIVNSPVGMPGRAVSNEFIKRAAEGRIPHGICHSCIIACKPKETPYCITDALVNAVKGNVANGLVFCGANAYLAEKMEHVEEIMNEFRPEA